MKFCSNCGSPVARRVPEGDNRLRFVCDACGTIHYENPKIVAGCVPEHEGRLLICRRAIEPRRGYWTIPAGFMENGESLARAAAREAQEEALADVRIGSLLAVLTIIETQQVHVFYRATFPDGRCGAGPESLEVALVTADEIPWDLIAFRSTRFALQRYLEDRAAGTEPHHLAVIRRGGEVADDVIDLAISPPRDGVAK